MKTVATIAALVVLSLPLAAQEKKPVPKDSVRVFLPGCYEGLHLHRRSAHRR